MYLQKEKIIRPLIDFGGRSDIKKMYLNPIEQDDVLALIAYMSMHGFKLGFDFWFIMGVDAPVSKQFNRTATMGSSLMMWNDKTLKIERQQYIAYCIEKMKEDAKRHVELEAWDEEGSITAAPFHKGQKVRGTSYAPAGSRIKKGEEYIVSTCHYSECKGKWYWYVGVEGVDNDWMTPRLFEAVK